MGEHMGKKVALLLLKLSMSWVVSDYTRYKNVPVLEKEKHEGAFGVTFFFLVLKMVGWIFSVHHVPVFIGEAKICY